MPTRMTGGGAGYAFAEAAVAQGGMGAVQVAGLADPYAGNSIDISLVDPSNPSGYPQSEPGSDPLSSSYTVSGSGITFTGSGEEMNGDDELEAFVYNGNTDMASLESELGASSSSGTTSSGDVTGLSTLESDFGLIPLDAPIDDPSSISSLNFTENTGDIDREFRQCYSGRHVGCGEHPGTVCGVAVGNRHGKLVDFQKAPGGGGLIFYCKWTAACVAGRFLFSGKQGFNRAGTRRRLDAPGGGGRPYLKNSRTRTFLLLPEFSDKLSG